MNKALALFAATLLVPSLALAQPRGGGPIGVIVSPAAEVEWVETIEALGTLKAREQVVVTATVADKVAKINFEDGQAIEEGQVIIELDSGEEQAELQSAKSAYSEAEKQYKRVKGLRSQGAAPQSTLDEQRRVYEIAKAQVGVAEATYVTV